MLSTPAAVAPIAIPLSNVSGAETVIDFNSLGFEEEITTQFNSQGVSFSGGIYATAVGNSCSRTMAAAPRAIACLRASRR